MLLLQFYEKSARESSRPQSRESDEGRNASSRGSSRREDIPSRERVAVKGQTSSASGQDVKATKKSETVVHAASTAAATVASSSSSSVSESKSAKSAVDMNDESLVRLLMRPPKETKELRTKSSFQDFFHGISEQRMRSLLMKAYDAEPDCEQKVAKRLALLHGHMV